jgi:hypothetical protein
MHVPGFALSSLHTMKKHSACNWSKILLEFALVTHSALIAHNMTCITRLTKKVTIHDHEQSAHACIHPYIHASARTHTHTRTCLHTHITFIHRHTYTKKEQGCDGSTRHEYHNTSASNQRPVYVCMHTYIHTYIHIQEHPCSGQLT